MSGFITYDVAPGMKVTQQVSSSSGGNSSSDWEWYVAIIFVLVIAAIFLFTI